MGNLDKQWRYHNPEARARDPFPVVKSRAYSEGPMGNLERRQRLHKPKGKDARALLVANESGGSRGPDRQPQRAVAMAQTDRQGHAGLVRGQ